MAFDGAVYMERQRCLIEAALDRHLPPATERPEALHRAMRYSIEAGGKRLRPILCLAAAEALGGAAEAALPGAVALEFLHTYTLIHDDLPAMDNDALRRGRPTVHRVFGEATAILAGDALLTLSFEVLAGSVAPLPHAPNSLARELAAAAGSRGVVGGQAEDLAAEGQAPTRARLEYIHLHKTAKLMRAACRMGAIAAGAAPAAVDALGCYGASLGLAFQIADDILNITSTADELGKAVGSDAARRKLTWPALVGLAAARSEAETLVETALTELARLSYSTPALEAIARFSIGRRK